MRTRQAPDELVDLQLTDGEHHALASVIASVLVASADADIVMQLRTSPELAHAFLQSVCVLEARAAIAGVPWLDRRGSRTLLATSAGLVPALQIDFGESGSVWRLTIDQFAFVGRCIGVRPELMRWAA